MHEKNGALKKQSVKIECLNYIGFIKYFQAIYGKCI